MSGKGKRNRREELELLLDYEKALNALVHTRKTVEQMKNMETVDTGLLAHLESRIAMAEVVELQIREGCGPDTMFSRAIERMRKAKGFINDKH